MRHIAIIGAGNIGQAIAHILKDGKTAIALWDKKPRKVPRQKPLASIIPAAQAVFLCVPSSAIAEAGEEVRPFLSRGAVIVSIAKGIEKRSGKTIDKLLSGTLPGQPVLLLSGPMLAAELLAGSGGAAIAASKSASARALIADLFRKTELHVRTSKDVQGTAIAGVLKNIYALLLGALDGMGYGWNAKGLLAGEILNEMADILPLLGGSRETAHSPAGFGDLIATGMSPASRNHQVGSVLATGSKGPRASEGTASLPFITKRLGKRTKRFPLLVIAERLLKHPAKGRKALLGFIRGR